MASGSSVCIVLDGANVATRKDGQRAIPRLAAALAFFREIQQTRHCVLRCVAFVPNFWLNVKPADASKGNGSMETDDWDLLKSLVDQELVVLTPSHAHDDFYVIDYAVKNDGFVVTNDMFRDHVDHKRVFQGRRLTQRWVRSRCIDFTFVGNEFLPNSQTIERALGHQPQPNSPRDTLPASAPSSSEADAADKLTPKAATTPAKPRTPRRKTPPMRSTSLTKSVSGTSDDVDDADDAQDDDPACAMAVDNARKRNVDLSELTPYRVPRYLLPFLHGDDGQTLGRFMDHTATYIVAPPISTTSEVATLTIYGPQPNRMQAVKILDAALPEMQEQYEFQLHEQQQQQWLLAQQQQQQEFQQHQSAFQHHQQLHAQQFHPPYQHQYHHHQHIPANYPLQHHHHHYAMDDHMDMELE